MVSALADKTKSTFVDTLLAINTIIAVAHSVARARKIGFDLNLKKTLYAI